MKDLSHHILDIFENTAKAGGSLVSLEMELKDSCLMLKIEDNGPGFPESIKDDPVNPYSTTRKERKVGLGLSLLNEAAEQTGGWMRLGKSAHGGILIECLFKLKHPDAKPLGDIEDIIITAINAWPALDWIIKVDNSESDPIDTRDIRKELEGIPIQSREVLKFIEGQLSDLFGPLRSQINAISPDFSLICQ